MAFAIACALSAGLIALVIQTWSIGKPRSGRILIYVASLAVLIVGIILVTDITDARSGSQLLGSWKNEQWNEAQPILTIRFEGDNAYIRHSPTEGEILYQFSVSGKTLNLVTQDHNGINWKYPIVELNDLKLELKDGRLTYALSRVSDP